MSVTLRLDQVKRYSIGGFVFEQGKPTVVKDEKLSTYLRSLIHENGHPYFSVYQPAQPEPTPEASFELKESVFDEKPSDAELVELFSDPNNIPEEIKEELAEFPEEVEKELQEVMADGDEEPASKRGRPKKNKHNK